METLTVLAVIGGWYALGLIGSALLFAFDWEYDITVRDIAFGMFMALAGGIMLVVAISFLLVRFAFSFIDADRVVWRRWR